MEQQEGKWFMNNLRAMIQDELKQALNGLIPLLASEMTPVATISPAIFSPIPTHVLAVVPHAIVNPPIMDAPSVSNDNAGGQPFNVARNVPEMKFEDVKNFMVEKAKKESASPRP